MSGRDTTPIKDVQAANIADVIENGPGLRVRGGRGCGAFVIAKDTANGYVYLGGLGGLGVGTMWSSRYDGDALEEYPGWDDAPDAETLSVGSGAWASRKFRDPLIRFEVNDRNPSLWYGMGEGNRREDYLARAVEHHVAWLYAGGVCKHDHRALLGDPA